MTTWILILLVYAGSFAKGDDVTLTNVPGFKTADECMNAGRASERLVSGTKKDISFVCVAQSK